ncbi:MAG: hypothetical protein JSR61_01475 [Proteobacteria bacterium]|nr:hypothetical protein [Pseudomonadota bacterium]
MPRLRLVFAAAGLVLGATLAVAPSQAQQKPSVAPAKPYKSVMVSPPAEMNDAGLNALRDKVGEAVKTRDRAALAPLTVAKGFFWEREGGDAGKGRAGIDVLTAALGLTSKDAVGWDILGAFVDDPNAAPSQTRKDAVCAPADPRYDAKAFDALLKDTQTDVSEWGYPASSGIEVHAAAQASAPVVGKLGLTFVRVMPEESAANPAYLRVLMPNGKTGYVTVDSLVPFGNDQLCYVKQGGAWKIGGYIGAGEPQ